MADNVTIPATGSGTATPVISTEEVTTLNGGAVSAQHVQRMAVASRTADGTAVDIIGDSANGLDVDVTRVGGDVSVVGKVADGAAVAGNPVLVAGQDGTNVQSLKTDANGELQVDVLSLPALPAGGNNIGDVDLASAIPAGDNNIGNVDIVSGPTGASALQSQGAAAHDAASAGNPLLNGAEAIAHGTNPTAVAAGDATKLYANRAGVPFVIGGHPNVQTLEASYSTAQTDTAIITVGSGLKIVVTQVQVLADADLTVTPQFRIGFGTTNTPTTAGVVASHPGLVPGSIYSRGDGSGILGVGADGEDLRITSDVATGGTIRVLVSYYTIES